MSKVSLNIKELESILSSSVIVSEKRMRKTFSLKKSTAKIDYGCNFDSEGCSKYKVCNHPFLSLITKEKGCCSHCADSQGYLHRRILVTKKQLKAYRDLFDPIDGYFRKGGGCILPREYRSGICLSSNCYRVKGIPAFNLLEPTDYSL